MISAGSDFLTALAPSLAATPRIAAVHQPRATFLPGAFSPEVSPAGPAALCTGQQGDAALEQGQLDAAWLCTPACNAHLSLWAPVKHLRAGVQDTLELQPLDWSPGASTDGHSSSSHSQDLTGGAGVAGDTSTLWGDAGSEPEGGTCTEAQCSQARLLVRVRYSSHGSTVRCWPLPGETRLDGCLLSVGVQRQQAPEAAFD